MNTNPGTARAVVAAAGTARAGVGPGKARRSRSGGLVAAALGAVLLVLIGAGPCEAAFPGANGKIAFATNRDGNYEIYVMNADGSGQRRLTNNARSDSFPAWSPDGTRIAFTTNRDGNDEIYVMNADGSGQKRLTHHASPDTDPAWSPDGKRIAFATYRDGNFEIYVMYPDGSGQTRLTTNRSDDFSPAWSPFRPDGTRIAFTSHRDSGLEIYSMNVHGGGQTRLTHNVSDGAAWSPDGTRIAFGTARDGNGEIYVMNANGEDFGVVARLTHTAAGDGDPAWSPDGRRIAFTSDRSGNHHIYVMNADGSRQTRLTSNTAYDYAPDWQPVVRPAAPTRLGAQPVSPTAIELRWRDTASNETRYELLRRKAGSPATTLKRLPPNQTRYIDRALSAATSYAYALRACNSAGCSRFTSTVSTRTLRRAVR